MALYDHARLSYYPLMNDGEREMKNPRYLVQIKRGRKVHENRYWSTYDQAMEDLDFILDNLHSLYGFSYTAEFKDTQPRMAGMR
mgnify:CR=1 FL=1